MRDLSMIIRGHCVDVLDAQPCDSVQMVATSPPYWGLRQYDIPDVSWPAVTFCPLAEIPPLHIDEWAGQFGQEPTIWGYVAHMVLVMRAIRRVLRDDGVVFLNVGDSYHNLRTHKGGGKPTNSVHKGTAREGVDDHPSANRARRIPGVKDSRSLGSKPGLNWWKIPAKPYPGHNAAQPEALAERLVLLGSDPRDRVLDPFSGSGTTGAVAVRNGREYLGIEFAPGASVARVQAESAQSNMFVRGSEGLDISPRLKGPR